MKSWFVACEEESYCNKGKWSPSAIASYETKAEAKAFADGVGYGSGDIDTFVLSKDMTDDEIEYLVIIDKGIDDPKRRGNLIERLKLLIADTASYTK